jgi:hypothetical protein
MISSPTTAWLDIAQCEKPRYCSALARVDYIAFLALLMRRGKFDVPKYMNLDTQALPRQFNFFSCRDFEAKEYA